MSMACCRHNRAVIFLRCFYGNTSYGALCVAFAGGLIVATCCPGALTVVIIAAALVLAGLGMCRY